MRPLPFLCLLLGLLAANLCALGIAAFAIAEAINGLSHAQARDLLNLIHPYRARTAVPPPGVIVARSKDPLTFYMASPSIAKLADGTLIASHDWRDKARDGVMHTDILSSTDGGESWEKVATVPHCLFANLFTHNGALYLLGVRSARSNDLVIHRSHDGGKTWTSPDSAQSGELLKGRYHTAPMPVLEHDGRLWRAIEVLKSGDPVRRNFGAMVISAPVDADLLDADSWTASNAVFFEREWINAVKPEWLEGNVLLTPESRLINLIRLNARPTGANAIPLVGGAAGIPRYEAAAALSLSNDGKEMHFDPQSGFLHLPGAESKFTIRYDRESRRYWALLQKITAPHNRSSPLFSPTTQRNVIILASSADLRHWTEHEPVLSHRAGSRLTALDRTAFQYLDWIFDGDDIVAVSRTAWDAVHYHDANYITFHRIADFRRHAPAP